MKSQVLREGKREKNFSINNCKNFPKFEENYKPMDPINLIDPRQGTHPTHMHKAHKKIDENQW